MSVPDMGHRLQSIAPGIHRLDTHYQRPGHTACYIVVENDRAAVVDCGVPANVPAILAALEALGPGPAGVDQLILTHAHLDHAGAAGVLIGHLPAATVHAHPAAAAHLIEPGKLEEGVRALYGDAFFDREYAPLEPIEAGRVVETPDGATLDLAGRALEVLHTPGHAWHHESIHDPRSATVLAGDAFGVGYPALIGGDGPFIVPVTPPPQFDPEALCASTERIVELAPARVAPTHFEVIDDPVQVAADLRRLLAAFVERGGHAESAEDLQKGLLDLCADELARRGRGDEAATMRRLYGLDLWLSAVGIWVRRRKQEKRAAEGRDGGR